MKSFSNALKTMTVASLSFLFAVPSGNVILAEEVTEISETVIEETEEVSGNETAEPEEENVAEETAEPEEENIDGEVTEEAEEAGEETIPEETAEEEEAVSEDLKPEEVKPSDQAETDNAKTGDASINATIADHAVEIALDNETNVNINTGGQYQYFKFIPSQAGVYTFASGSSGYLNPYGYLYDSAETIITYRNYGAPGGNFRLFCELDAGVQYYFGARLSDTSATGSFMVTLNKMNEGWNQIDSYWYYIKDGHLVNNKALKIGNNYYGFDSDGRMYTNCDFSINGYDADGNNKTDYYRAKADGTLYVSSWYRKYSDWYYYGADAKAAKDIIKVNGKDYLFDEDGRLLIFETRQIGGLTYISDENGCPVKVDKNNGWLRVGSAWFYIENGTPVTDAVRKAGNSYYGFDSKGKMYVDTEFSVYVSDENNRFHYDYYRAKADGTLYVSSWYKKNSDWYYYGSDGKRASGVQIINGKTYIFYEYGGMARNTTYSTGSTAYLVDEDGAATKLNEGWTKADGFYYYVDNGTVLRATIRQINGSYYGFSYECRMFDGMAFELNGSCYKAKPGGALYTNTWVGNYYYGPEGKAYSGVNTVDGVQYFFTRTGEAVSNQYILYNQKLYYTDAKCVFSEVAEDGLYRNVMNANDGKVTTLGLCVSDGKVLKNEWKNIDGKRYYFGSDYFYCAGSAKIGEAVYYFNHDGTMCGTGWQKTVFGSYIYAYSGGELVTGKKTIDGKNYCFDANGNMKTGLIRSDDGYELYANNGQLIGSVKTGWNEIYGTWYYFNGSEMYANGVYTINGEIYCFDDNYRMLSDCVDHNYVLGSNGKAVKSGWVQVGANWYYVDPSTGKVVTHQTKQIGNKRYRFDPQGVLMMNTFVYLGISYTTDASGAIISEKTLKNGWELAGGRYYYYKDGKPFTGWVDGKYYINEGIMIRNNIADGYWAGSDGVYNSKAGWIRNDKTSEDNLSCWMYAKTGGKLIQNGWAEINGAWYYFNRYQTQITPLKQGPNVYYFDVDGKLIKTVSDLTKDQWVNTGDYWGYIKNESPVNSGKYMIAGREYLFSGGRMQKDKVQYYYDSYNQIVYYVQSDGAIALYNGWKKIHGKWYFFDLSNGSVINGWISDGGKKYYIDADGMAAGWRLIYGRLYNFASDGALVEEVTQQNGWLQKGGSWYYFVNGMAVVNNVKSIKGKVYGFNAEGRLGKNELIQAYGLYYADVNGVIVKNTWKKIGNVWYYFGADGQALKGVQKINGTIYYFNGYTLE